MKPKTKKEIEIYALHQTLPAITEVQKRWAKEHCFDKKAYRCKDEAWCSECGKSWIMTAEKDAEVVTCPYCGKKLKVEKSRRSRYTTADYMTIGKAVKGYQVLRHVYVEKWGRKDGGCGTRAIEVCQQWFDEKGGVKVLAKSMQMVGSGWNLHSPMSFKRRRGQYYYGLDVYNICGIPYPKGTFIPILRKYGLKTSFHGLCPGKLIKELLEGNNTVESLFKQGQYQMAGYVMYHGKLEYKWAVNICNRNHYKIKDASMYDDYIHLLEYFHKDTHNAFYVCPKNLKKEHDRLLKKKRNIEEEMYAARQREWARENITKRKNDIMRFYKRMNKEMLNIVISGDGIDIRPLQNVTQFYLEGKHMHHCVYDSAYYAHDNCLILTARKDGKRLETIEVNTNSLSIIQSRAVCNGMSEYHKEIIDLVNKNMNLIRKAV